jgi:hypothetical protein
MVATALGARAECAKRRWTVAFMLKAMELGFDGGRKQGLHSGKS